jgi:hypothetical protein
VFAAERLAGCNPLAAHTSAIFEDLQARLKKLKKLKKLNKMPRCVTSGTMPLLTIIAMDHACRDMWHDKDFQTKEGEFPVYFCWSWFHISVTIREYFALDGTPRRIILSRTGRKYREKPVVHILPPL